MHYVQRGFENRFWSFFLFKFFELCENWFWSSV